MADGDGLAERFQKNRGHLRAVAYRILGSANEADDAVQEAWLRLSRSDSAAVENLRGWLTTVVSRVCLDMLRSRRVRGEVPMAGAGERRAADAEADVVLADSIGPALLVVLDTLPPAERVAFVLHDLFDLTFEEIAAVMGRSPAAARQLGSRARRKVRGGAAVPAADLPRQRRVVDAFLAAARDGAFDSLLAVLAPDVVLRADDTALQIAATYKWGGDDAPPLTAEVRGAHAVALAFKDRGRGLRPALVEGDAGAVWAVAGEPRAAYIFSIEGAGDGAGAGDGDTIVEIELVMEPQHLGQLALTIGG